MHLIFHPENLNLNASDFSSREFEVVISTGLLCVIDDVNLFLNNLLAITRKNGLILISSALNSDPTDTITRYRLVDNEIGPREAGWNI